MQNNCLLMQLMKDKIQFAVSVESDFDFICQSRSELHDQVLWRNEQKLREKFWKRKRYLKNDGGGKGEGGGIGYLNDWILHDLKN